MTTVMEMLTEKFAGFLFQVGHLGRPETQDLPTISAEARLMIGKLHKDIDMCEDRGKGIAMISLVTSLEWTLAEYQEWHLVQNTSKDLARDTECLLVRWFEEHLKELGFNGEDPYSVDRDRVTSRCEGSIRDFQKIRDGSERDKETDKMCVKIETELTERHNMFLEWRALNDPIGECTVEPPNTSSGAYVREAAQSAQSTHRFRSPCARQPHCATWEAEYESMTRKNKKRKRAEEASLEKKIEYLYLFAAQARCVECMKHYLNTQLISANCESSGLNARGWALQSNAPIDKDLEDLLRHLGL